MALESPWSLHWHKREGSPITVRGLRLTPESQALVVRWPFGGFVWNRPSAVLVESNGQTERIVIYDKTRLLEIALWFLPLVILAYAWLWRSSRRGHRRLRASARRKS